MLGKKTPSYMQWESHAKKLCMMPDQLKVVNTGSTPSYKAFDYSLWNAVGFNLAYRPQPLYYDFETLKKYGSRIAEGAVVLIGVEEFKFLVDAYEHEKTDYKYYLWLDGSQIRTFKRRTAFLMRHAPILLNPRFFLRKKRYGGHVDRRVPIQKEREQYWAEKWVAGWKREFGWDKGFFLSDALEKNILVNCNRLEEMIAYCNEHRWKPYLVVPPFSPALVNLLPNDLLEECLWLPLKNVVKKQPVTVINLYFDPRFTNSDLYEDALTFNGKGRALFNRVIQEQIGFDKFPGVCNERRFYTLSNGLEIPWISFGTGVVWRYSRNKPLFLKTHLKQAALSLKRFRWKRELKGNLFFKRILLDSYNAGYRLFDTGRIYGLSEKGIGRTVSKYQDVMITTKCSSMDVTRTVSPNDVAGNLAISLKNLRRRQVDLYLLHWPEGDWLNLYKQIIEEYKAGRCRAFGACNMEIEHLKKIETAGLELPMVMQTEIHPLCARKELREYCQTRGIQVMAHTATGRTKKELRETAVMKRLTKKYHKSCAQIVLRWHYQNHVIPVVSTYTREHTYENLQVFDFKLTDLEMAEIDALDGNRKLLDSHGIDDPNYIYND